MPEAQSHTIFGGKEGGTCVSCIADLNGCIICEVVVGNYSALHVPQLGPFIGYLPHGATVNRANPPA